MRKISNAHIFEPIVARDVTRHRLLDEILSFFGGRAQPMMAQLAEAGKLTRDDIQEIEKANKARREMTGALTIISGNRRCSLLPPPGFAGAATNAPHPLRLGSWRR